jgi:hypothetical protein
MIILTRDKIRRVLESMTIGEREDTDLIVDMLVDACNKFPHPEWRLSV